MLATRLLSFVLERYPFALPIVRAASSTIVRRAPMSQ